MGIIGLAWEICRPAYRAAFDAAADAYADARVESVSAARQRWLTILSRQFCDQENLLPGEADARALEFVGWAEERARARGALNGGPLGEYVLRNWGDYCRSLIDCEGVTVPEIRYLWDTDSIGREALLLLEEHEFRKVATDLRDAVLLPEDVAAAYAWRFVPVYGMSQVMVGAEPNHTPLPLELSFRVRAAADRHHLPEWLIPLARAQGQDAVFESIRSVLALPTVPTYNCWIRQQVSSGFMPQPRLEG